MFLDLFDIEIISYFAQYFLVKEDILLFKLVNELVRACFNLFHCIALLKILLKVLHIRHNGNDL